jgi:hypothetical protein
MQEATLVMTLKNYYRRSSQRLRQAESQGVPVYVLRNNTVTQMERQLATIFQLDLEQEPPFVEEGLPRELDGFVPKDGYEENFEGFEPTESSFNEVMLETELAISQLMHGERDVVEMAPQNSYVRRKQHQMAERYNLRSKSRGHEPYRRVRIYR